MVIQGGDAKVSTHTLALIAKSLTAECPIEIAINSYYHHWFKIFIEAKNVHVHFFSNDGSFSHLFNSWIEPNVIRLCLAIRITFV